MNTLKQLVLQEADTQKILLKIQTFMKCALEVRAGPRQSRELPYFPALPHVFPGVGEPPRARLCLYCSGDGFALVELCVWAALRNRYQSQAEERVTTHITVTVCTMTKGHITMCSWDISKSSWPHLHSYHLSILPQEASVSHVIIVSCWSQGIGFGPFCPCKAKTRDITIPEFIPETL